ncbi:uncharacterized protein LOC122067818 [Macadamia integrifolia]|uniref:uncharacterized protein LOC122067818 n=1 Tax=Macadamia integrifolia TaxID=60698 RepID=UPI001C500A7D|nr:uncharacterized protein LOC122067818 [Macadamia integrifolia]
MVGDFNTYLQSHEKKGPGNFSLGSAAEFNAMIDSCSMAQLPSSGRKFIWSNNRKAGNVSVVLDRSFYNEKWLTVFQDSSQLMLPRIASDHGLILMVSDASQHPSNCPFCFHQFWMEHEGFVRVVALSWSEWVSGPPILFLTSKLKRLKKDLKSWARFAFANFDEDLEHAKKTLNQIHDQIASEGMNDHLCAMEADAKTGLVKALENHEKFWAEKARIRALKKPDGTIVEGYNQIGEYIVDFYERFHRASTTVNHEDLLDSIPKVLNQMDYLPGNKEITRAVWELDPDSSSGLDGFSSAFFRKCWDMMEVEVLRKFGFSNKWINWLHQLLLSTKISILVNGGPQGFFGVEHGLRQGDPISPMLFIIAEEVLSRGLSNLVQSKSLKQISGLRGVNTPGHILFADNIFIFTNASLRYVNTLKSFLMKYQDFSGQCINFEKSKLFLGKIAPARKQTISDTLGIQICTFPTRY